MCSHGTPASGTRRTTAASAEAPFRRRRPPGLRPGSRWRSRRSRSGTGGRGLRTGRRLIMGTGPDMHDENHRLARRAIAWGPPWVRQTTPAVREAAEHTKLWWAAPVATATFGGWRGRTAAAAGVAAMTMAHVLSNAMAKRLYRRRRHPGSSSRRRDSGRSRTALPSTTAATAATAFASTGAPVWPTAGAACGPSASMVSAERVRSGAPTPPARRPQGDRSAAAVLVLAAPHLPWRRRF